MNEPLALLNGQFVSAEEAVVGVYDAGFMLGATVAEQLRTFNGQLFRLGPHLDRLMRSLEIVGVDSGFSKTELSGFAEQLIRHNHALIADGDDLGLSIFVTPGPYGIFSASSSSGALVCMHTYLQPFHLWARAYDTGQSLMVVDVKQVPGACWPAELKCRSRMHYFLADQKARRVEPEARALLLDEDGNVTEASTANLVIYRMNEGLLAPPTEKVLPGISIAVLADLAENLAISLTHRDLRPDDVAAADEVILCSTSPCLLPVTRFNGQPIGSGIPGSVFRRTLDAWSKMVGVDVQAQANRFAQR